MEEQVQAKRLKSTDRDRKLVAVNEKIRSLALSKKRGHERDGEVEEVWSNSTQEKYLKSLRAIEKIRSCSV